MTPRDEFHSAVDELERTITELALLAFTFRRLERDLWPEAKPPGNYPDFDYMTGMPPEVKRQP